MPGQDSGLLDAEIENLRGQLEQARRAVISRGEMKESAEPLGSGDPKRAAQFSYAVLGEIITTLGSGGEPKQWLGQLLEQMHTVTGCDAVGIRLKQGPDYPYFETRGFSEQFVRLERHLCQYDEQGRPLLDKDGNPVLDCMCGNIIQGRYDPSLDFFTSRGSFWSNHTTVLLASTTPEQRQARTRNRCNGAGYESVVLVPLRFGGETYGLMQFNDQRVGHFSADMISFLETVASAAALALSRLDAHKALAASETKYRALFDNAADAIFIVDETMRFTSFNHAACTRLGYSEAELLSMGPADIDAPEAETERMEIVEKLVHDGVALFETVHMAKDGRRIPVEIHARRLIIEDRPVYLSIARDISERKKAEAALRESEARFRDLFHSSPVPLGVMDTDGRIIDVNKRFTATFSYALEDIPTIKDWRRQAYPDQGYRDAICKTWDEGMLVGSPACAEILPTEFNITCKNGDVRCVIVVGITSGGKIVSSFTDITDRRKTEDALRQSELKFRTVADNTFDWETWRDPDGEYLWVSPSCQRITGYAAEEFLADPGLLAKILHPEDAERVLRHLGDPAEQTSPLPCSIDYRIIRRDGEVRWINHSCINCFGSDGASLGRRASNRDITSRVVAEHDQRESEKTYRSLFENTMNSVLHARVIFDGGRPVDMEYLAVNPAFATVTGITEPVVGRRISEVIPGYCENHQESLETIGRVAATGVPARWEHHLQELDRWFFTTVYSPSPGEVVIVTENITERKRAELALQDNRRLLSAIVEGTSDAIFLKDSQGRYVLMNRAGAAICGKGVEDILGRTDEDLFPPEQAAQIMACDKEILAAGAGQTYEERITLGDGNPHTFLTAKGLVFDSEDHVAGVFGITRDISRLKEATETLAHREALLQAMLRNLPLDFWARDRDERIIMQSGESIRLWGDLKGKTLDDGEGDEQTLEQWRANNRRVLTGEVVSEECPLVLPGGETRVFHNVVAPIRDEAVALGILGINLDITERKKNESALLRAKDQAEAANRAKSSFLANMSHEIRTPLNGLLGMLQLIRFGNLSAEQQQYVEMAERSGRRLTGLLGDILDLSRIESGRMPIQAAPFALVDVCTALAETFSPLRLEKNLAFSLKIDEAIPQVLVGDELRVRQVLFNLIGNAMKFTDRGEVRGEVSLIAPPPNGGVRLLFIISDTGIGIPDDKLDQICSPFTQVDQDYTRAHQGAGLGLAIARQLVLAMGGTLTFESTANQGTSVYLMLPLGVPDHALRPVKPSQGWRERPSAAMRILLVEDEEISRLSARLILERLGHAVVTANDGKEALEALRKSVYDCVLMDVQMDVMGGVETTKNIRSGVSGVLDAQVPIIALTAYAMTGDREKFIGVGMNDYVTKPVQLEDLKNALWRVAEEQGKGSTP